MKEITKEEFIAYEDVRKSGVINMWDTQSVCNLSGLDFNQIRQIRREYDRLVSEFCPDREIENYIEGDLE